MSNNEHIRVALRQETIPIDQIRVTDHGDGHLSIFEGNLVWETTVGGFHAYVEQVWSQIFAAGEHKKYLDSLLPKFPSRLKQHRNVVT